MRKITRKKSLHVFLFLFFITALSAQNAQNIWSKTSKKNTSTSEGIPVKAKPKKAVYFDLDMNTLKNILKSTPKGLKRSQIIQFPNSQGDLDSFEIEESSILEPGLQAKYPGIRTYVGKSITSPSTTISFSITSQGLHAMTLGTQSGAEFINPYTKNGSYAIYSKKDLPVDIESFRCLVTDDMLPAKKDVEVKASLRNVNDRTLRTYRLAVATTIEYSRFHWQMAGLTDTSPINQRRNAVLEAMVVTMNRVNAIYQRDLAVKMILVENNTDIIFVESDNFSNNNAWSLIDESQRIIDEVIGAENYDMGHTFSTGGGGLASLNSPCQNRSKARGITGQPRPVGDPFDVDYVAHEMGHQFGAPHTFNFCDDNRTASNAYEPGGGTTIMAYAGICGANQNIQSNSDAYFHQKSIQMIWDNISSGASSVCGERLRLTNRPAAAIAGPDYTIPISTPYKLVGSSTDPDGINGHTYTWEQYDLGPEGALREDAQNGPMVRSFPPTTERIRYIPEFTSYLETNGSTTWEKLSAVNRTMTFALTVRDNAVFGPNGGGQTAVDFMTVNVNSTIPFTVSNPDAWVGGTQQRIQWNVGQTANVSTINCQKVNIKLSTDGGLTFPITIASNTQNDGLFVYNVPNNIVQTNKAKLLVEAADNIFYDVSNTNFSISPGEVVLESPFIWTKPKLKPIACGATKAQYEFNYNPLRGNTQLTKFSVSGLPQEATVRFIPSQRRTKGKVVMIINNLDGLEQGNYRFTLTATAPYKKKNRNVNLPFFNELCTSVASTTRATRTTLVRFNTIFNKTKKTAGYADFTAFSTTLQKGSTYNLNVRVNTAGNIKTNTVAWIDWNQNCKFDANESYSLGTAQNVKNKRPSNSPYAIVVPNNALLGSTTLRIITKNVAGGLPNACQNGFDGETEDYTINVVNGFAARLATKTVLDMEYISISPNPNNGAFNITANNFPSNHLSVSVYDVSGRLIFKHNYKVSTDLSETINLKNPKSGLYVLVLNDDINKTVKKIVVE